MIEKIHLKYLYIILTNIYNNLTSIIITSQSNIKFKIEPNLATLNKYFESFRLLSWNKGLEILYFNHQLFAFAFEKKHLTF